MKKDKKCRGNELRYGNRSVKVRDPSKKGNGERIEKAGRTRDELTYFLKLTLSLIPIVIVKTKIKISFYFKSK